MWMFLNSDLYHLCGDQVNEAEGYRMHTSFSQDLLKDHFQSSQMSEHGLIQVSLQSCLITLNVKIVMNFSVKIWRLSSDLVFLPSHFLRSNKTLQSWQLLEKFMPILFLNQHMLKRKKDIYFYFYFSVLWIIISSEILISSAVG